MQKLISFLVTFVISATGFSSFAEWVEAKKWDFQTYSNATWLKLAKDTAQWKPNGEDRFDSNTFMYGALKVKDANIPETAGILFPELEAKDICLRKGLGLQLGSRNKTVVIPKRFKGEKVEIVISGANSKAERGLSAAGNMIGDLGRTIGPRTYTLTVMNDGDISFDYSGLGGIILRSITIYADDVKPDAPSLYKVDDIKNQSIYAGQPLISDIVYTWGNSANSAFVTWTPETPEGITVTPDMETKTITISGIPASAGIYNYSIASTDGVQDSKPVTGTINVKGVPAGKKFIAYITDQAVPVDAVDVAILKKLRETYEVAVVPADTLQPASQLDMYDAIVLAALPKSATVPACLKGINKPLVSIKPYMFNLWGWATLGNMEAPENGGALKDVPSGVVVSNASHPVFAGLGTTNSNAITLSAGSTDKRFRILTPVLSWTEGNEKNIITLATVPAGAFNYTVSSPGSGTDASGKPVIFEVKPGSVMSDGTVIARKSIYIGMSERTAGYLTPQFLTIVKNAVDYVMR